ncbi:MAG: DUF86 domain-containing protein [Cyanobium sp.]
MTIVDSADAIGDAVAAIRFVDYCKSRLIRAAVEREFITIGEALKNLSRIDSGLFFRIDQAPRIISFRNKPTHEYGRIDDALVWGVIQKSLSPLRATCSPLIDSLQREEG